MGRVFGTEDSKDLIGRGVDFNFFLTNDNAMIYDVESYIWVSLECSAFSMRDGSEIEEWVF